MDKNNLKKLLVYNFEKKIRCGNNYDGGYILGIINDNDNYDCYISCGVSTDESFTRDFLNLYKINKSDCYAFDGTIEDYPWHFTENICFNKKNIGGIELDNVTNLEYLLKKYSNIFIKMDIEGGEYPWLLNIDQNLLKNVKQLVIEFHGINNNEWGVHFDDKIKCYDILNNYFNLIHVHGNVYGGIVGNIPNVIECTYINKKYFNIELIPNKTILPTPNLDYSNSHVEDYQLNFYPFVQDDQPEQDDQTEQTEKE